MMGAIWYLSLIYLQSQIGAPGSLRFVALSNVAAWLACVAWAVSIELFLRARFKHSRARRACFASGCE
jgi:hypothetical protein